MLPSYCLAQIMSENSGLSDAPPTRNPSISGCLARFLQLAALTEPTKQIKRVKDLIQSMQNLLGIFYDAHLNPSSRNIFLFKLTHSVLNRQPKVILSVVNTPQVILGMKNPRYEGPQEGRIPRTKDPRSEGPQK